jgi:hypothetical protein
MSFLILFISEFVEDDGMWPNNLISSFWRNPSVVDIASLILVCNWLSRSKARVAVGTVHIHRNSATAFATRFDVYL